VLCAIAGMGGAEFSLLELVKHLRDSYEFHLIIPGEGPFQRHAEAAGAKVWILPWPEAISARARPPCMPEWLKILRAASSLRPFTRLSFGLAGRNSAVGVYHQRCQGAHHRRASSASRKHVPLIWYMRDGLEERILSRKLLALLSRRCDMSVCISHYVSAQFREYVSASLPSTVIYNIVDLNRFHPGVLPPADLRKGPDEVWFGLVGAITPLKGTTFFSGRRSEY
jgi:glycosyltransferase involved in cell wall biosynthesis